MAIIKNKGKNLHITAHIFERKRNNIGLGKIEKNEVWNF